MHKANAVSHTFSFEQDVSVDVAVGDKELASPIIIEDPKLRIITLYNRIQMLKEASSKLLVDIKQCKNSFRDANEVIGELNGNIKKSQ